MSRKVSHNPYYDNGIKLIDCYGEKMPEEILLLVEDYIDGKLHVFDKDWPELPFAHREHIGCTVDYVSGRNRYMGYLISLGIYSFKGVKVGLDCANGSSWNIAKSVFDALGADTYVINAQPNGLNINNNAGSTHIEGLQKFVVEKGLDIGFAYDGDADRCLCVDEKGNVITGDHICGRESRQKTYIKINSCYFIGKSPSDIACIFKDCSNTLRLPAIVRVVLHAVEDHDKIGKHGFQAGIEAFVDIPVKVCNPLAQSQRHGVVLKPRRAECQRTGNQVERVARAQHNRHQTEQTELLVSLASANHQNADGDNRYQIDSVKKRFNKSLHSCCSPFLVLSFDVSATGTAGCRIGSQATLSP